MSLYGTPAVKIEKDTTDRVGIRTLVLSQLWAASAGGLSIEELDAEEPAPPAVPAGVLFIGRERVRAGGGLRTLWTFEGIFGNGKDVTFKDRIHSIDYNFEPGFSEKSALRLPGIQDILNQFGGYVVDGQIIYPPSVPSGTASGPIASGSGTNDKPNPLFGQDTFFSVEGTYHFRYYVLNQRDIPTGFVGMILKSSQLPGEPPPFPDVTTDSDGNPTGRNWLALPPAPTRVGPGWHVEEMFWLSGDGGWPTPYYGQGKANPNLAGQVQGQLQPSSS
jgi:hypothetical protein